MDINVPGIGTTMEKVWLGKPAIENTAGTMLSPPPILDKFMVFILVCAAVVLVAAVVVFFFALGILTCKLETVPTDVGRDTVTDASPEVEAALAYNGTHTTACATNRVATDLKVQEYARDFVILDLIVASLVLKALLAKVWWPV